MRSPKRRETQPPSNVLLAMSPSANQQKVHVGTFTYSMDFPKTISRKSRWREMFKKKDIWCCKLKQKKYFVFSETGAQPCSLFNTKKHWIFSTLIFHEKLANLIIAYPNIVRPRDLFYFTKSLQLTQRTVKVAVLNLKGVA